MAKYSIYGQKDDQIIDESDVGFIGFNNRIRPDQLKQGMLAYSQNGRIDINGEWRVRGGIETVSSPFVIESDSAVLRLPTAEELSSGSEQGYLPYKLTNSYSVYDQNLFTNKINVDAGANNATLYIVAHAPEGSSSSADSYIQPNDLIQIEGLNFEIGSGSTFVLSGHWDPDANGVYTATQKNSQTGAQYWQREDQGPWGEYDYQFITYRPDSDVADSFADSYFVFIKQQGTQIIFQHNSGSPVKNELFPWQEVYGNDIYSGKEFTGTFSQLKYNTGSNLVEIPFPNTPPGVSYTVGDVYHFSGNGYNLFLYTIGFNITNQYSLGFSFDLALTLPFSLSQTQTVRDSSYTSGSIGKAMELASGISATSIVCSTSWSNPSLTGGSYVIMATQGSVSYYNVETGETGSIGLPANESIPSRSSMLQAFNKVYIFRDGQAALEWDGDFSNPFVAVSSGSYTQPTQIALDPGSFFIKDNIGSVAGNWNVTEGQTIEVLSPGEVDSGMGIGESYTVYKTFEPDLDENGNPRTISIDSFQYGSPEVGGEFDGLIKLTVTTTTNHGLELGEPILFSGVTGSDNDDVNGNRFVAEILSDDEFVVYVYSANSNPDYTATGTIEKIYGFEFFIQPETLDSHTTDGQTLLSNPILTKRVPGPGSLGYTHMPAPEFAVYHQRRLAMPFRYSVGENTGQYSYRGINDEVIFSDILDADTYDEIYGQFRFNAGTSDYLVGLHSFSDDKLVVFNRNSIHIVVTSGAVSNYVSQLITNEVGCVARKSVVQIGSNLLFLSDNGIYGVNFQDLYNLRGNEVPLSESIDPIVRTINKNAWQKSCAVYFDNRYYIAVPTGNSDENNTILIYNFLNKQWESVDTVNNTSWNIQDLIVAGEGSSRGVFAVSTTGSMHKLDTELLQDEIAFVVPNQGEEAEVSEVDIDAEMLTRQMTMNSLDRKKWHQFEIHAESNDSAQSDFDIGFEFENPDSESTIKKASELNQSVQNINGQNIWYSEPIPTGEDVSLRGRIGGNKAYGLQFRLNNFTGSPKIRALKASASVSSRSITRAI